MALEDQRPDLGRVWARSAGSHPSAGAGASSGKGQQGSQWRNRDQEPREPSSELTVSLSKNSVSNPYAERLLIDRRSSERRSQELIRLPAADAAQKNKESSSHKAADVTVNIQ